MVLVMGGTAVAQDDAALDALLDLPTAKPAEPTAPAETAGNAGGQLQRGVERLVEEGGAADMLDAALRQMEDVTIRLIDRFDPGHGCRSVALLPYLGLCGWW